MEGSSFCRSLIGWLQLGKAITVSSGGVAGGVGNKGCGVDAEILSLLCLAAISESNWREFNKSLMAWNSVEATIASVSRFFLRNALPTIPKRVATTTVSYFLEDPNHDGSTIPPFVSERSKIWTSAISALKNGKESLLMNSCGLWNHSFDTAYETLLRSSDGPQIWWRRREHGIAAML